MRVALIVICFLAKVCFAGVIEEFVFTSAPFASCHASTVVELKNGDVLAAWFGGTAEGRPDVAIWSARRHAGRWSPVREIAREPQIATFNPVLFYAPDGRLWLYYKFGPHPSSWTAARKWSDDDGETWSAAEHLPAGLTGPIRAKPLLLPNGVLIAGTSVESYHSWACWIERSTDRRQIWTRYGPIAMPELGNGHQVATHGIIQPSVVAVDGRHLRLYARATEDIGHIVTAESFDEGQSWTEPKPLDLPNPNSGIDALHLADGRYVLIYNHSGKGRTPLNLAVSRDGLDFKMVRTLESEPGEYSYPALIQSRSGELLITYTWNRKRIKFVSLRLDE